MVKNTSARTRGPFNVADAEERDLSMRRAIAILLEADIRPDDKRYLLDMALWRFTEFDKNRYKFATRYRTSAVVNGQPQDINHEHVVPRRWLLDRLLQAPHDSHGIMALAVACIVTTEEHRRLTGAHGFGWARYRNAQLEVLDTADGMKPLDLDAAVDDQSAMLRKLNIDPALFERVTARATTAVPAALTNTTSGVESSSPARPIARVSLAAEGPRMARTGRAALYYPFWTRVIAQLSSRQLWSLGDRQVPDRNWLVVGRPLRRSSLQFDFCQQGLRHQVNLRVPGDAAKSELLAALNSMQAELEEAFGGALSVESMPGTNECRIAAYRHGEIERTPEHATYLEWFLDAYPRMQRVIPLVKPLV